MSVNPLRGMGNNRHVILQKDIEAAWTQVNSAMAVARYLNVSYKTYKKYARLYGIHKTNQHAYSTRRKKRGAWGLDTILDGGHPNYDRTKLKLRLIAAGYLPEKCNLCGFDEKRIGDGKVPLLLIYKDGDNRNIKLDNLELRCYNCSFLTVGKVRNIEQTMKAEFGGKLDTLTPEMIDKDVEDRGLSTEDIESIQNELMSKD